MDTAIVVLIITEFVLCTLYAVHWVDTRQAARNRNSITVAVMRHHLAQQHAANLARIARR